MKWFNFFAICIVFVMVCNIQSTAVCDLKTLIIELKQDLADNGMLDCLRKIDPPHFVEETEEQKNLRLAAQWDTSCSFESSSNWPELLLKNYGITNLVDSTGEVSKKNFKDQADMCEIVRAAVAQNIFDIPELNMQKLPEDFLDKIDCAGVVDSQKSGPRICAATVGSFFQKDSWSIFLKTGNIRLGGVPNFIMSDEQPKSVKNPFNSSNPSATNNLIKDLLKFSKDQLDMKQGELANMIDKARERSKMPAGQEPEKDNQQEKSKDAHVHVKRIREAVYTVNKRFGLVDGANTSFKLAESRIVFGFYMATVKFEKAANAYFKLMYAGREIPESRQAIGSTTLATLTGAFGEVYNPKTDDPIPMEVYYDVNGNGTVASDSGEQNFSFGVVTLPLGQVFKKINSGLMEFHKSETWNALPNFELSIKYKDKTPSYFLVMYNLAFPMSGKFTLETRLKTNKNVIPETAVTCGPTNVIGSHTGIVIQVQPGTTNLSLEYKFNGDSVQLQDFTDNHYIQSITAFQLPQSAEVKNYKLDKPYVLNTDGEWKGMDLEADIVLKKKKTVLILYNINLKIDNATFTSRIRVGNKYNKKSIFTVTGQAFANAQGYVVKVLKPGKYNFDIDFRSNAETTFDPANSELDGQIVNMQIVLLD